MATALPAAAELPDSAREELGAGTYDEQRRCAEGRRRQERSRRGVVTRGSRRSDGAVQPWIASVDHLAREHATTAYSAPAVLADGVIGVVLMLPRQAQPHAPGFLALAQGVVALQ